MKYRNSNFCCRNSDQDSDADPFQNLDGAPDPTPCDIPDTHVYTPDDTPPDTSEDVLNQEQGEAESML